MAVGSDTVQVVMPAMGDSVAEGTVLEWRKQVGDTVQADETIVEISTDKVDAEVPSPIAGTIVKIHASEGEAVAVGAPLAEISADGDGVDGGHPTVETPVSGESPPTTAEEQVASAVNEAEGTAAAEAAVGKTVDILTPTGGESVTEGTILEWSVKVGDTVKQGDTVVEISTDKVDMELPAPVSGTVTEILAGDGDTVTVGQVIGRMAASTVPVAPEVPERDEKAANMAPTPSSSDSSATASPVARRAAAQEGVDLQAVRGSARRGRITKADVLSAAGNGATAAPQAAAPTAPTGGAQPLKGGAAALARYMEESRSVPTATSFRTITVTELAQRRAQLKEAGHRVSFTHLIAYAIARVLTDEMPVMGHHYLSVDGKPNRVDDGTVNLGLAVDVERKDGSRTLMVPVIRDAGHQTFSEFVEAYNV